MKYYKIIYLFIGLVLVSTACELEDIPNPNAPTFGSVEEGATQADLKLLTAGIEAIMRNDLSFHYETISIIGREYFDLTGTDPRYTGELLIGVLDNNGFLTTRAYAAWYKVVQSSNLLERAVLNANANLADSANAGYIGYAQTLKAYALMMVANRSYENGIRTDVADPNNPGPFRTYQDALSDIQDILADGYTNLNNAGERFDFYAFDEDTPESDKPFNGLATPELFAEFNQAIAARVAIYQEDKAAARSFLQNSFLDLNGDLSNGPYHRFGVGGNDIQNNLFYPPNQANGRYIAHDSWVADAEAGDQRLSKVGEFLEDGAPARQTFDDISGDYQVRLFSSNVAPMSIIRNEELVLLWAEANIGTNNAEAINALNIIRNAAGLADYSGANTDAALEDELLNQRRYSLFGEGHRWIDLRRYDRLDEIPTDRAGDSVAPQFPTPVTEEQAPGGISFG